MHAPLVFRSGPGAVDDDLSLAQGQRALLEQGSGAEPPPVPVADGDGAEQQQRIGARRHDGVEMGLDLGSVGGVERLDPLHRSRFLVTVSVAPYRYGIDSGVKIDDAKARTGGARFEDRPADHGVAGPARPALGPARAVGAAGRTDELAGLARGLRRRFADRVADPPDRAAAGGAGQT